MTACDDGVGLGLLVAIVLHAAKQVELAHRHRQVCLLLISFERGLQDRFFYIGIGRMPIGRSERLLHFFQIADNHEVHHVAGMLKLVVYAPRQVVDFAAEL